MCSSQAKLASYWQKVDPTSARLHSMAMPASAAEAGKQATINETELQQMQQRLMLTCLLSYSQQVLSLTICQDSISQMLTAKRTMAELQTDMLRRYAKARTAHATPPEILSQRLQWLHFYHSCWQ